MIDFIVSISALVIIGIRIFSLLSFIFGKSFHDKCYKEMESCGNAIFEMCSGQMVGDYETRYLYDPCIDCPYFVGYKGEEK